MQPLERETLAQSLADELLELVWSNPMETAAVNLKKGSKCPRCKHGIIISNWHSSVCMNCGLSEDYENRYTLMEEHLINWLLLNNTKAFSPPRWLLLPESHAELSKLEQRLTRSLGEINCNDSTPSNQGGDNLGQYKDFQVQSQRAEARDRSRADHTRKHRSQKERRNRAGHPSLYFEQ